MLPDHREKGLGLILPQFENSHTGNLWRDVAIRIGGLIMLEGFYRKYHFMREKRGRAFSVDIRTTEGQLYGVDLTQERQRGVQGEIWVLSASTTTQDRVDQTVRYNYNTGDARSFLSHLHDGHLPGLTLSVSEEHTRENNEHRYLEEKEYLPILESLSRAVVDKDETLKSAEQTRRTGWKVRWIRDLVRGKPSQIPEKL